MHTDYIDFYLIHNLNSSCINLVEKYHAFEQLKRKQEQGIIKYIGFSFHDSPTLLHKIVDSYTWDFAQIQLNYIDYVLQNAKSQYEILSAKNLPIIVMEPVRGGALAVLNQDARKIFTKYDSQKTLASWALRYVMSFPNVLCVLSGMSTLDQVQENINTASTFIPISSEEYELIKNVRTAYLQSGQIVCTGCHYCDGCPVKIDIPNCFALFNQYKLQKEENFHNYSNAEKEFIDRFNTFKMHKIKKCLECHSCEQKCPQHILISQELKKIYSEYTKIKTNFEKIQLLKQKTQRIADNMKYDIGIYGLWYGNNYGSMITYYALNHILMQMGYSTVMINNPLSREPDISKLPHSHQLQFAQQHYHISPRYALNEMNQLNNLCNTFLIGSDQLWNYNLSKPYQQTYFLDFVSSDKKKIAYATSFGIYPYNGPEDEKLKIKTNLARFQALSVRDQFSQRILKEDMGLSAEQMLDPVFLCCKSVYEQLIQEEASNNETGYIFAYILDPSQAAGECLLYLLTHTKCKIKLIFDKNRNLEDAKAKLNLTHASLEILEDPSLHTWLNCFQNALFVVTDSFHGICFSILFAKTFLCKKNLERGGERFNNLLEQFGLLDYMVERFEYLPLKFEQIGLKHQIDYHTVYKILEFYQQQSLHWLKNALSGESTANIAKPYFSPALSFHNQQHLSTKILETIDWNTNPHTKYLEKVPTDIQRCQMVAALLRDYRIRHIVVSSGARDVSLVRLFEANTCFITHNITDERSAAYFALGLASAMKEPVALTCTSGTAVANYLPGITEAYFQQIPIAVISGDRYPYFSEQMEPQKTDHLGALQSVVKASVELPTAWDGMAQWETRRKISHALLEMTHHGMGPVHINVPMDFLENRFPHQEYLRLPNLRHINRIELKDEQFLQQTAEKLKNKQRILLISGQALPMSEDEQKIFNSFCSKINCVVLTDHLSNLHNNYTINPFNLLRNTTREYFISTLMPDLVIYFGGKRVLNDPLTGKMRSVPRTFEFWRIDADGKVADLYRTLTHIYEMSPNTFFQIFDNLLHNSVNDNKYYSIWKKALDQYPIVDFREIQTLNSSYTIGATMAKLPKFSILHLGVGTAFNYAHYYSLDPTITVYCNMGTNDIDGSASTFMGQALVSNKLAFLFIGDLSFFYDMNSIWNKKLKNNIRILMNNDNGAGFLRHFGTPGITQMHGAIAKGWVESLGFLYLSAKTKEEFDQQLPRFVSDEPVPMFFETFIV